MREAEVEREFSIPEEDDAPMFVPKEWEKEKEQEKVPATGSR